MKPRLRLTLLVLLALAAAPFAAGAQCLGDDGFYTGQCYHPVKAKLPVFPPLKLGAKWIPWKSCTPVKEQSTYLVLPAPVPVVSGVYVWTGVELFWGGSLRLWDPSAAWLLFYTRTWMEIDTTSPTADKYQVWRFLVNADVKASAELMRRYPLPNPANDFIVPPCVYRAKVAPVHYFGYVDYALNCRTRRWYVAFGVTHLCDIFMHHPFSPHPAGGHPDWSYTVVAPATFNASPTLPGIQGIVRTEAFRMYRFPSLPLGESEQAIRSGFIATGKRSCPCGKATPVSGQFIYHNTQATTVCRSWARSITPFPVLWGGSVQMSVGTFTGPRYPGKEELYFVVDPMFYFDGLPRTLRADVFVGVGTQGGWRPMLFRPAPTPSPPRSFLDLQNVLLPPTFTPGLGGLFISDILIYLNTY